MAVQADRLAGCFLGLCLGDALGAVVEARPAGEARDYVENELRAGRAGARGRPPFRFGQYTDDSQLARELLISIREQGGFDPAAFARRIMTLVAEERLVGGGRGTLGTARRLQRGVPWETAGASPPYAGNGAAMRVAPLGLLYGHDPELLARVVLQQSRITHRDPRAAAGALAIAGMTARAGLAGPLEPGGAIEDLARLVAPLDRSVADALPRVLAWLPLPLDAAIDDFHAAQLDPAGSDSRLGVSSFVSGSVIWSLYAFLRTPEDYWQTVCCAITIGGDTDTMAAMAGAIVGARLGMDALPTPLLEALQDRGSWTLTELVQLARDCAGMGLTKSEGRWDQATGKPGPGSG